MTIATWPDVSKLGAVALKSSGAETSSSTNTAVEVGKGKYRIELNTTAVDCSSNDEMYIVVLEANTRAATSSWYEIGVLFAGGDTTVAGRSGDPDAAESYEVIVDNPYDYQVRVRSFMTGTSPSITYSVDAYRVVNQH